MLGKLFKYEFKSTARWMLPCYVFVLLMSLINMFLLGNLFGDGMLMTTHFGNYIFNVLRTLFAIIYFVSVVALGMITMFMIVFRFYKNLLSNEGYISWTLPVSVDEHLFVKLATAITWILCSMLVITLSLFILMAGNINIGEMFSSISTVYKAINYGVGGKLGVYIIEIILNGFVYATQTVLMLYCAMAIGQLSDNHKIGMAIVAYLGISVGLQILWGIAFGNMVARLVLLNGSQAVKTVAQYGFFAIIWQSVLGIGFYLGTRYILTKRINLQ